MAPANKGGFTVIMDLLRIKYCIENLCHNTELFQIKIEAVVRILKLVFQMFLFLFCVRMIYLSRCLCVSRMGSTKTGRMVVLYTKELKLILAMEDTFEQDDWYLSIRSLMELEQKKKVEQEHMLQVEKVEVEVGEEEVEEDEGYWTLPPAAFFREVKPQF